jgi:hypothetical protein
MEGVGFYNQILIELEILMPHVSLDSVLVTFESPYNIDDVYDFVFEVFYKTI